MQRAAFHKTFKATGPVVTPVIHVLDTPRTLVNVAHAIRAGVAGVFLINHDFGVDPFLPIIRDVRARHPGLWLGVNFLGVTGRDAFSVLGELERDGCLVDGYWGDDARIDETDTDQSDAEEISAVRVASGWSGLYFGGTAFKMQRPVPEDRYKDAARHATRFMDVVTTSGVATGQEADTSKIGAFRAGVGDTAIALASGVTPENARTYRDVDCFMVATGINQSGNFYDIDPERLQALMAVTRDLGAEG